MKSLRIIILCIALFLCVFLSACSHPAQIPDDSAASTVTNPIQSSTVEDLAVYGYHFNIPEDAENIAYHVISMGSNYSSDMGEAQFTLDDIGFTYRILTTTFVEDISGTYYTWSTEEPCSVGPFAGELHYINDKNGYILWYNQTSGQLHCLYMDTSATENTLTYYAAKIADQKPPAPSDVPTAPETLKFSFEPFTKEQNYYANDGTFLAECSYNLVKLTPIHISDTSDVPPNSSALVFNEAIEEYAASCVASFDQQAELANEAYAAGQFYTPFGEDFHYYEDVSCTYTRVGNLFSVQFTHASFTGGAHGNYGFLSWNYDLDSAAFITPDMIAKDKDAFISAVANELLAQAEANGTAEHYASYNTDYAGILYIWNEFTVTFTADGMIITFDPYLLGPYAMGPQIFVISYEFLTPYLNDYALALLGLAE